MKDSIAIILVGGRSRRMNLQDKMDLKIGDDSFLEKIKKELSSFSHVVISANKNQIHTLSEKYKQADDNLRNQEVSIVEDVYEDVGPLGGIYSVMVEKKAEYYFVVSCDMPFIKKEDINQLYKNMEEGIQAIVGVTEGRKQPLFAIYKGSMKERIWNQIQRKDYRIMNLVSQVNVKYVELQSGDNLYNVNTPEDLEIILENKVRKN